MPSFILIHPTVWPQCTNVTDRQDRQTGQWSDSIRRTVLQTVAQKFCRMTMQLAVDLCAFGIRNVTLTHGTDMVIRQATVY